jgi:uncharacterized membrane protein YhaH (DUF805 family)
MFKWYKKVVFENYANFNGRARRSEYWYFTLVNLLIAISFIIFGVIVGEVLKDIATGLVIAYGLCVLYALLTLLPNLGLLVRRLHDIDKSGWFYFIAFIPFVGSIWLLVLFCTEGTRGVNQYGADPKNEIEDLEEIGKE